MSADLAPIDWSRTEELRSDVGEDDFIEIAGLFLAELAEMSENLPGIEGPSALSAAFHSLKGAALNLGFENVARLAATGEAAPEMADIPALQYACKSAARAFEARYDLIFK